MCCDWQGTHGEFIKSEDLYKIRDIGPFSLMFSGRPGAAHDLMVAIFPYLNAYGQTPKSSGEMDLRVSAFIAQLKSASMAVKRARIEHHIQMTYGVTAAEFRDKSRAWFSNEQHEKEWHAIKSLSLECSLIIGYADDETGLIITIESDGSVAWSDPYACIGSGSDIALVFLCQIRYDEHMELMPCLQRLYFAKQMAQKNPYVGDDTGITVLIHGQQEQTLFTNAGWAYLKNHDTQTGIRFPELTFDEKFLGKERA